jgi:phosphohistidine phosphatase
MPRRLLLMRHAKSSWNDPSLADHERPLNGRGRRDAEAVGAYLGSSDLVPDAVLCSSATRARETLERSGLRPRSVRHDDALYGADAEALLSAIRNADPKATTLAVIGHDPGIHDLASSLAGDVPGEEAERLRTKFPTGAVAAFDVEGAWADLSPERVRLTSFVRPRELPA